MYLIEYTTSTGKKKTTTASPEELHSIIERLDAKINRGTCGGYIITSI